MTDTMFRTKKIQRHNNSLFIFIDKCQSTKYFNYFIYVLLLVIALLIKANNIYLNIFSIVIFALLSIILKFDKIVVVYVFLCFFDSVMKIDLIGGGITRILTSICLIRIIYLHFKDKIKIKKTYLYIIIFLFAFLLYTFLIGQNVIKSIFLYVNICFAILLVNYLSYKKTNERQLIYYDVFESILYGVFFSIIYGMIVGNYMIEQRNGFITKRFSGTIDPNFTAFYINIALIINLFKERKIKKEKLNSIVNIIIYVILIAGLLLTKSITGLIINTISMVIFILIKNKHKLNNIIKNKKLLITIITITIVVLSIFGYFVVYKNIDNVHYDESGNLVANNRIADIIYSIKNMDIDKLTSHKSDDWRIYWDDIINSDFDKYLLGHGMYPELIYSQHFSKNVESHNTYLDLLRCYGILGSCIIVVFLLYKISCNIFLSYTFHDKTLKYVRIMIMIYAFELSIYTGRIFWFMFII